MNERLVVKSFGPIRSIDINFRKVNLFIGDQGTGKSCIVKLYSTFRWLEKTLLTETYSSDYFTKFVDARFKNNYVGIIVLMIFSVTIPTYYMKVLCINLFMQEIRLI